jgi:hypothetical protein
MTSILGFGLTALLISVFIWVLPHNPDSEVEKNKRR